MDKSQIVVGPIIKTLVAGIKISKPEDLSILRDVVYKNLNFRPYNEKTKEHEKAIRWRRNAEEILKDGYVYNGKACTDIVIAFMGLCKALGIDTRFVKVKKKEMVHSIAEIKINNECYLFDISRRDSFPERFHISKKNPYNGWKLWQKGTDAWNIGLSGYDDIKKIKV